MDAATRRVLAVAATCTVAIASLGFSGQAFAVHDPQCDTYGANPLGVFGFTMDTPDSHASGAVSNVTGSGYACGSDLAPNGVGNGTLYNHANIGVAPGVVIPDTEPLPYDQVNQRGSYAGYAYVHMLYRATAAGGGRFAPGGQAVVRAEHRSLCEQERLPRSQGGAMVGEVPQGPVVACLKAFAGGLGYNLNWATRVSGDSPSTYRYVLTLGPIHTPVTAVGPGITYINFNLCGYFGSTDPGDPTGADPTLPGCGTSGQYLQRNGDVSAPDCNGGAGPNGRYTISGTLENGTPTAEASTCVSWTPNEVADPVCANHPDLGVHDFSFQTTDSTFAYDNSGIRTALTACDSQIRPAPTYEEAGSQSLFTRFDVGMPPGVEFNPSLIAPEGSYIGRATVNALSWRGDPQEPAFFPDLSMDLRVASQSLCPPGSLVCLRGATRSGSPLAAHNAAWVKRQAGGPPTLTFGELQNDTYPGSPAGITKIADLSLCAFAGPTSGTTCGARGPAYLFRNGLPGSTYYDYAHCQATGSCPVDPPGGCAGGRYHYTATATTRDGRTTAPAYSCYGWDCNPVWRDTGCRPPAPRGAGRGKPTGPEQPPRFP